MLQRNNERSSKMSMRWKTSEFTGQMERWTSLLTNRWRDKLVALSLAALIWFLVERAIPEPSRVPPPLPPVTSAAN